MEKIYNEKIFLYLFLFFVVIGTIYIFSTDYETYGGEISGEIYKVVDEKFYSTSYYIKIKDEKIYCTKEKFEKLLNGKEYVIYWASNNKDHTG